LVFYFIFVAVGIVLIKERRENQRQLREQQRAAELGAAGRRPKEQQRLPLPVAAQTSSAAHDVLKLRARG
jgi:hypothetical protein